MQRFVCVKQFLAMLQMNLGPVELMDGRTCVFFVTEICYFYQFS